MSSELVVRRRMVIVVLLLAGLVSVWWSEFSTGEVAPLWENEAVCDQGQLCVAFLDVGQGDAVFIQTPRGVQMLVDSGRDLSVLRALGEVMDFSDRSIDYALITHPDADHIGGLSEILKRYDVARVIRTENESDSTLWAGVERDIEKEGSEVFYARRGQRYDLGSGVVLEILFPDTDPTHMESNTSSIVAKLTYGNTSFMLTGDSPKSIEEYLVLMEGEYLRSDVLKVGHHGSRTSTSEMFLAEVAPKYAVISASADNSYGHPHLEVTDALFNYGVVTYNTAEEGHIIFSSDGVSVVKK